MGRVSQIVDCLINRVTAKKRFAVKRMVNKKAFQSNANCPLVDSPCFIVNRFEHVGGGAGTRQCTGGNRDTVQDPRLWTMTDRQTQLKTLPSRNFVGGL